MTAALVAGLLAGAPAASGQQDAGSGSGPLTATVLSSRPDTVSGGDALIQVEAPPGVPLNRITVRVGERNVTDAFQPAASGHAVQGLVDGLAEGENLLTATVEGTDARPTELTLTNHPRSGPVFAGPHETPFICQTEQFRLVNGDLLGPATDANCSVDTRVDYVYRTTGGQMKPLPKDTTRPEDVAWTTINTGERVPWIVRVETGTINRAVYEIAMLADPEDPEPGLTERSRGWNGKLVYTLGGGCPGGWYVQGKTTAGVTDPGMIGKGYAVASSSLNVFGQNCNDLLAAESLAMVKERFVEAYGGPEFTIGWGCSGGAYQAHQIGDNYPGLLDGIIVGCSFPDVGFGTLHTITDARLLNHYFQQTAPETFTREQQRAVSGFGRYETLKNLADAGGRIDPRIFCPAELPQDLRYDPDGNPGGARCDVYSHTVNAYGTNPDTGKPQRPLDNTGIEYGRQALETGVIDVDQFLDLNEGIGGFDADANQVPERTVADPGAVEAAYATGRMLNGGGGLAKMPIIDQRTYTDDAANGDIHLRFHSFSTRDRLKAANGTSANHVMLVDDGSSGGFNASNTVLAESLDQMDVWLTRIGADHKGKDDLARVIRNKPADLTDACWTRGANPERVQEEQVPGIGTTRCNTEYPVWPSPRMVAGGTMANDVITCQKQAVDPASYGVEMTDAQVERLHKVFPDGVCDWTKPGVGQRGLDGTWHSFPRG